MEIKETSNPVGEVVKTEHLNGFIESMKALWDATKTTTSWWKLWKRVSLTPVTTFLLKCLDDLIAYVDQTVDTSGADKKATVMWAVGSIYDYIIKEALPIWLKPFASSVRNYIINVLISASIDWIVEKYRHGSWRPKTAVELEAKWFDLRMELYGVPGGHRPKF